MKPVVLGFLFLAPSLYAFTPIPNGVETNDYPEVVYIFIAKNNQPTGHACTGTVVGPNAVLTAAHCLEHIDTNDTTISIYSDKLKNPIQPTMYFVNPYYTQRNKELAEIEKQIPNEKKWEEYTPYQKKLANLHAIESHTTFRVDTGLLMFDEKSTPLGFRKIKHYNHKLFQNKPVSLVGYGMNDMTAYKYDGKGTKRIGTNHISSNQNGILYTTGWIRDSFYHLFGLWTEADGNDAGIAPGDSGGPMIDSSGNVIGVNVGRVEGKDGLYGYSILLEEHGEAIYSELKDKELKTLHMTANLSHKENVHFFEIAKKAGFKISYAK